MSRTLEYAYDDYVISQLASLYGDIETQDTLLNHSFNYITLKNRVFSSSLDSNLCINDMIFILSYCENRNLIMMGKLNHL